MYFQPFIGVITQFITNIEAHLVKSGSISRGNYISNHWFSVDMLGFGGEFLQVITDFSASPPFEADKYLESASTVTAC